MAAVAGSKGKVAAPCGAKSSDGLHPSFQASLVSKVLTAEFTPERAAQELAPSARLRETGIDTNMTCNLKCRYCYLDDRPVRKAELSVAEWYDILLPLAESGCKLFAFIGKEPLLDDVAIGVLSQLNALRGSRMNFRTGMVTNGTQLHRHVDRLLEAQLSYLDISLDGLPEINDRWRGNGVSELVLKNLSAYLARRPQHDIFVACVMHQGNVHHIPQFAEYLFDLGVPGFFTSPVLKFTKNISIKDWAIDESQLNRAIESLVALAHKLHLSNSQQIVVDLPYQYAWHLLAKRKVSVEDIYEDRFEVPFWRPDSRVQVYIKMNLLSYSYWKAVRITHDGSTILNMDLAAHPNYEIGALSKYAAFSPDRVFPPSDAAAAFHTRFFQEHLSRSSESSGIYNRAVDEQYRFQSQQHLKAATLV